MTPARVVRRRANVARATVSRLLMAIALVVALVLALAGCGGERSGSAAPTASTQQATLTDPDGNGVLNRTAGEPLRDHTDLAPASRPGRTLVTLAQLTDLHVRDEESPSRVPFLDRYGEPFDPAFRPQEALSAQVLAAAVRAVDRERPDATLVSGDVTDNAQVDEIDWATRLLHGGTVRPDSGGRGYRGVQSADDPDPFYYRPDVDPPRHPGLLAAAQRPVRSPGLHGPWYGVPGNHDVLLQGELAPDARTDRIATGDQLVTSLNPRARLPRAGSTSQAVDALLGAARGGRTIRVPADARRRSANDAGMVAALARGRHTRTPDRADYAVDVGRGVRVIVLDIASRTGGQAAAVVSEQLVWLRAQLAAAGDRPVLVMTHQSPPDSMLAVLDAAPNVVAAVHGDTHRNRLQPRGRYWVIGTSSLADWPMQARMLRLRTDAAGGLVLETWMVDQDGRELAGAARELAFVDAQGGRPQGYRGGPQDRNARLYLPAPR